MAATDNITFPSKTHNHNDLYYSKEEMDNKIYYPFKDKEQLDFVVYLERGTPIGSSQLLFFCPTNFQITFKTITVFRIEYVHNIGYYYVNPALTLYKQPEYLMWGTIESNMVYWFNTVHPGLNLWYLRAHVTY